MGVYRLGKWLQRRRGLIRLLMQFLLCHFPELSVMTGWAAIWSFAVVMERVSLYAFSTAFSYICVLEISKGNRAGCKNKECLENGVKIQKGELRFGTQVEFQEHQSWHWRHW